MKKKQEGTQPIWAPEGVRKSTGAAPTGRGERGRFKFVRRMEAVLRLHRGEALDTLSRELGVAESTLTGWKEAFPAAGQAGLRSQKPDPREEENARLKQFLGDGEMRLEIYRLAAILRGYELSFEPGKRK